MSYSDTLTKQSSSWHVEHRDLQATAMSVDWTGNWVLLAGRRHLALQSLEKYGDVESLNKFQRNSKYEVSAAEWAICQNSQEYCAIASSQSIEVVTWAQGDPTLIHSLRAHTRSITDIDWHSKKAHLLASCSIDTFTHLWDLRDPRKPIMSLSAVCMSGATQVGFNRVSGNLIATAHDGDLRIWDQRKGSCPIQYITAHLSRIHGINWSHEHETHLATASQDGTVKYFDINNPRRAEKIITAAAPVWRARYTPFADGLVTVILGRGDNSLLLWNNSNQTSPVASFTGHNDVVLDFTWRPKRNNDTKDMELITWSRDQTLRVWRLDEEIQKMCRESASIEDGPFLDDLQSPLQKSSSSSKFATSGEKAVVPALQHEFSLLNTNIPHIDVEQLDASKRQANVRITANGHIISLQALFPTNYPSAGCPPDFSYCQGTSLDENLSAQLMKVLKKVASHRVKKNRTCLEQCLREFVSALKKSTSHGDRGHIRVQSPRLEGALSGALHDACVPFPRTSGARFGHIGLLVTFSCPLSTKRLSLRTQSTPRALSVLSGGYLGNVMGTSHRDSNASFYLPDRKISRHRGISQKIVYASNIQIYDMNKIMFVNKELAENYIITNNIQEMCRHNKSVAEEFGTPDIVQVWALAEMISQPNNDPDEYDDMMCFQNPFAKNLLESLIAHFASISDVQTAAMLCCAFGRHCSSYEMSRSSSLSNKSSQSPSGSPYHTILPLDTTTNEAWSPLSLAHQLKQHRSNSFPDSLDDNCRMSSYFSDFSRSLLGDSQKHLYDSYKKAYADILYRWKLLVPRSKVLKYLSAPIDVCRGVEFVTECLICMKITRAPSCLSCRKPLLTCMLCRLPVRGQANACLNCGHGGHTEHMRKWFEISDVCATGCGCHCIKESSYLIEL